MPLRSTEYVITIVERATICMMQKEHTYHTLFRARLPIATLPKEFADRLTKSILDEVSRLYQTNALPHSWSDKPLDDADQLSASSPTKDSSPLKQITIILLLLANIYIGLLLQGCTIYQPVLSWYYALIEKGVGTPETGQANLPSPTWPAVAKVKLVWRHDTPVQTSHLPPLTPLKPMLPVTALGKTLSNPGSKPSQMHALSALRHGPARLHDPPGIVELSQAATPIPLLGITVITTTAVPTITISTALVTLPYEQTSVQELLETTVEPTAPTEEAPFPMPSTTPTPKAPLVKPTVTATPYPQQTPVLSIFEPTMTLTPTPEESIATAIAEATATPTLYIQPWYTQIPATAATAEEQATTSTPEV